MSTEPGTRLRADARRNREQILAAAKAMFAEHGPEVPMEEIARRAEVGVGTLYRRFPDREELIRAVAQDSLATVLAAVREAVAEEGQAWGALVRILSYSRELKLTVNMALFSPYAGPIIREDPKTRQGRDEFTSLLERIVQAAQDEGSLRPDVGAGDVTLLLGLLLSGAQPPTGEAANMAPERALGVILDGLRAPQRSTLEGRPLTSADIHGDGPGDAGCGSAPRLGAGQ